MKRALLLLLIPIFSSAILSAGTVDKLISNLNEITLSTCAADSLTVDEFIKISQYGGANDLMIKELFISVLIPDSYARDLMESLHEGGYWSDINYQDARRSPWDPSIHLSRIYALSKLYFNDNSALYRSGELFDTIICALDYWHVHRVELVCNNWWYNQILIPRHLGQVYLLWWDQLSEQQRSVAIEVMNQAQFDGTGQNRVWLAGNVLMRGLLEGDLTLVEQAREHIVEEIYQSLGEGLQYDNSFHQHGEQMQFGNYGLSYINSLVYWARVLRATPLAIDHERIAMLGDYITDGIQWTVWRGVMDPNAAARQVFDNSQRGKGYSLALSVGNMREADAENVETYDKYLKRNLLDISSENTLLGVNYFWHSDYFIARRDSWYASVRMNSDRILGFEMTNRENLQGVYSADGVLMVLVDGDEYHNIYPLWNWKRLPGLTCFDDGEPIPFNSPKEPINRSGFVGGVTSDSGDGIAVMHLLTDDIELRKGSFFLDDVIVALGSDINVNNSHPLTTTLDQRLLRTDAPITLGDGEKSWSFEGEKEERELSWLHHDKVGYILPESPLVEISRESRREPWSRIADAYSPDRVGEGVVFTASIKHSSPIKGGGYSYIVLPDSDAAQVAAFAANPSIEIVSNSSALQAISANGGSTLAAIFYEPTTLKCGRYSITPSAAVVLLLEHDEQGVKLTIADPTQRLDGVTLELEIDEKSEKIDIQLPTQQGYRGSCVSINID